MPELITYCERNQFYPRREDIEAILRRVDHDANRMISYEEFCEIASVTSHDRQPAEDQPKQESNENAEES